MATLGSIDLGVNTRWENEFEGSDLARTAKHTEDGRKFIFQKLEPKNTAITYNCGWQPYAIVEQLKALCNSGAVVVLTHNDNRLFNVMVAKVDATPVKATNKHSTTSKYNVILTLEQV